MVHRVSSPASTGGAGTFFEQHVAAYWLAQLLVRGVPPILLDCSVIEVHLQTERLRWHTDDFLIIGQNGAGGRRKLAGQVKRTFTVSAANEECRKAIGDFWNDFKNDGLFSPDTDRFALVTQRGTKVLLGDFAGLLDCARASRSGTDFAQRLATSGFISKQAVHYCSELRAIVGDLQGRSVTEAEFWPFLRCLHVLSLDLYTSTRQTESAMKTLLAHTADDADASGVADASWNALLAIAADAMAAARGLQRDDLPNPLRQRHSVVGGPEHKALQALEDHTDVVLNGIRSTIGNAFHLPRAGLVQEVLGRLESTRVVLLSGPAGIGKSAVVRDAITVLRDDHFAFGFRAEEFAHPHLDATLQNAQIPANTAALRAILASQDRKVLVIESVERLLEKSTRDAFSDLLGLAAADASLRIVLTCREYSTDLVRASFLDSMPVERVDVPPLDDVDLEKVETSLPALARPLANPALRRVLRSPYVLDKALQISWSADRPLPESEREFRAVFWRQIVRADDRSAAGLPHRRDETVREIALRRARALTAYVTCADLDPAVVESLRLDSLIVSPDQNPALVAPAHDVLEDWAVLRWIEQQHGTNDGSFHALSETIGTQPAVRRAYRIWVAELVDRDPGAADRLFSAAITEEGIPARFRDDTLVSLLRAPSSPAFLERHAVELLANDRDLLKRVIHLLRVACVTAPRWLSENASRASLFNVPDGPAWAAILKMVQTHFTAFTEPERLLLLGLVKDWANGVAWWEPYPAGAESAAAIAHRLLPGFDTYRSESAERQTLSVIARVPKADAAGFKALLRGGRENDGRDSTDATFRDLVFNGLEGMPAARDLPDLVVSVAFDYLLCSEADLQGDDVYRGSSLELETLFGLKEHLSHRYFPASAYRGPWLPLLQHHSDKGLRFLIAVFNHSADWYAHPRVADPVEPPFEIELAFADGTSRKQWANSRLWQWYRGTSVGPDVLQSLLMALERWLLDSAKARPADLNATLLDLLRRSDSAALTAVVASVATAFPHASAEALLVLLSSHACIQLDRQRMVMESQSSSGFSSLLPSRSDNVTYEAERKEANYLPHRPRDLELAIASLQLGALAARVHAILDRHREALPPVSEQTDDDRVWRLSMHRMDLRRYSRAEVVATNTGDSTDSASGRPARQVRLDLDEPEPDVKKMLDESSDRLNTMNARLGLLIWALHVFKNDDVETWNPAEWRQQLDRARTQEVASPGDDELDTARGGPGIVAAVCVRDHWPEMSGDEQHWCVEGVCSEVMLQASVWNGMVRIQRHEMSADRPCASVVSLLVAKPLSVAQQSRVRQAFITALTHSVDEVRWHAAWGVAKHLWSIDRELVIRGVNALAVEATLVYRAQDAEAERPYGQRRQIDVLVAEAASVVRQRFWYAGGIAEDAYQRLDITKWFGAGANARILAILSRGPTEPEAVTAFARTARTLIEWWNADDDHRRSHDGERPERNHEAESAMSDVLRDFVMRTSVDAAGTILQPLLDAVDRHPSEIHWIVSGLTALEDCEPNTRQFWLMWKLFADRVRRATWLARIDDGEHAHGSEMIYAIFLGPWLKDEVRHWSSLDGHAHRVHALFKDLQPSSAVLDAYVRFLYHFGEQSLPGAFVHVANRLQAGDAHRMLSKTNTVFMLEVLLQGHVYGRPLELKRERPIRDAAFVLLDVLVEQGSSAAFRMRDDFVTPVPAT